MDLSGVIVVALGILFFFGGAAWLEIHSRKKNRPDQQDAQQQPADSATPAGRTVNRRVARSE